eukprot:COSAG02_NODE_31746_length_528_cov_0.827506_1_plen_76_part_10
MARSAHQRDCLSRLRVAQRRCNAVRTDDEAIGVAFALRSIASYLLYSAAQLGTVRVWLRLQLLMLRSRWRRSLLGR